MFRFVVEARPHRIFQIYLKPALRLRSTRQLSWQSRSAQGGRLVEIICLTLFIYLSALMVPITQEVQMI
jgi:hypothetical protein